MKLFIVLSMLISSAFANETLLTCSRTTFSDLDKIVVSTSDRAGEVVVTEIDERGNTQMFVRDEKSFTNKELELSSWYGYSRKLYFDGSSWNIEYHDECSGGVATATCE